MTTGAVETPPDASRTLLRRAAGLADVRDYAIVLSFATLAIALTFASDAFLTQANLSNVLLQQTPLLVIATAGTLVIIAGGFDVSVGAIYALSGVIAVKAGLAGEPALGLVAGVGVGAACGLLNGLLTTVGRINSFILTLATSLVFRGVAFVITGGTTFLIDASGYTWLGGDSVGGVKIAIVLMVVWVAVMGLVLGRSVFGRCVFAAGDNSEAARLAGIRVGGVRTTTFVVSGLAAGIGGVIASSQFHSAAADSGVGMEFASIAAIVVGGTSILGGQGAIWRTVLGVLFIAMIGNGFALLEVDPIYQQIVQGLIIVLAVGADSWTRRRQA